MLRDIVSLLSFYVRYHLFWYPFLVFLTSDSAEHGIEKDGTKSCYSDNEVAGKKICLEMLTNSVDLGPWIIGRLFNY